LKEPTVLNDLRLVVYNGVVSVPIGEALAYFIDTDETTKIERHFVLYKLATQRLGELIDEAAMVARARIVFTSAIIGHFCCLNTTIQYECTSSSSMSDITLCSARVVGTTTFCGSHIAEKRQITHLFPCSDFLPSWSSQVPISQIAPRFRHGESCITWARDEWFERVVAERDLLLDVIAALRDAMHTGHQEAALLNAQNLHRLLPVQK
jgi:hypothetical protein